MANLNKVMIIGNLTRDPETRLLESGTSVTNLGVACNRTWSKDGDKKEETTFVECEAWGKTAEIMAKYLSKGRPVFVEGRLKLDEWEDKEGNKRSRMKVVVENFQFLGTAKSQDSNNGTKEVAAKITEDDIPF